MKIEEKVKQILAMLSGAETVGDEAVLQDDLALDSLLMVTMLIEIEDAFGITLDELKSLMKPELYVGRAPEQVTDFLTEDVSPVIEKNKELLGVEVEINV